MKMYYPCDQCDKTMMLYLLGDKNSESYSYSYSVGELLVATTRRYSTGSIWRGRSPDMEKNTGTFGTCGTDKYK